MFGTAYNIKYENKNIIIKKIKFENIEKKAYTL
jgi:hypothetical protein